MSLQIPIILRSGRVMSGFDEHADKWTVKCEGWTEQLRTKIPSGKFDGQLKGFSFNRYDPETGSNFDSTGFYQQPHIYLRELSYVAGGDFELNEYDIYLDSVAAGGYLYYSSIEDLRTAALDAVNAQTGRNCSYSIDDTGDLVFQQNDTSTYLNTSVSLAGSVPWALGWGYIDEGEESDVEEACQSPKPYWARERGRVQDGHETYIWTTSADGVVNGTGGMLPSVKYWLHLKNTDTVGFFFVENSYQSLPIGQEYPASSGLDWVASCDIKTDLAKNKSQCSYYYQYDIPSATELIVQHWLVPLNEAETERQLHFTYESNVSVLTVGDGVAFGEPSSDAYQSGEITAKTGVTGGDQTIETDFTDSDDVTHADSIGGDSFYGGIETLNLFWCPQYSDVDMYKVVDAGLPKTQKPSDIFKTLLGVDIGTMSGISPRRRVTTIIDLFGSNNNEDRELIDWDAFDTLADASTVEKAHYTLKMDDDKIDMTVYELLMAVCITLGIQMCYEYQETQRAKVLTFKPFKGESAAQIAAQNKYVNESDLIIEDTPTGDVGGTWLYSALEPEIYDVNGALVPISANQKVGSTNAPVYQYKDVVTVLKAEKTPGEVPANFINNLYDYAVKWNTETWTQTLACTIAPFASLSVGSGCIYSASFLLDRFQGGRGVTDRVGDLVSMTETWGRSGCSLGLEVQVNQRSRKGWAPSVDVLASDVVYTSVTMTISAGGFETDYEDNKYQPRDIPLVDQAYFGCWMYNKGTDEIEQRNCSCGNYKVIVFEKDTSTLSSSGSSRNVWYGTFHQPTSSSLSAGSGVITLYDDTNFSAVRTTLAAAGGSFAIDFAPCDYVNVLEPCQLSVYGFLGDSDGVCSVAGGDDIRAIEWG